MNRSRSRALKGLLVVAVTATLVVGTFYLLSTMDGPHGVSPGELGKMPEVPLAPDAGSLRDQLLHGNPQQLGVTPVRGVWGVLMERGYAKGTATVIALADGTASMYLSTGASVMGSKAYMPTHLAAEKLCEQAASSLGDTTAAHDFPVPAKGRARLYVLTTDGVRVAETDIVAHPDASRDALAPVLAAGDAVLEALKEGTSKGLIR